MGHCWNMIRIFQVTLHRFGFHTLIGSKIHSKPVQVKVSCSRVVSSTCQLYRTRRSAISKKSCPCLVFVLCLHCHVTLFYFESRLSFSFPNLSLLCDCCPAHIVSCLFFITLRTHSVFTFAPLPVCLVLCSLHAQSMLHVLSS